MFILNWFAIAMAATIVFSLVAKPCMGKGLMQIGSPFILRTWDMLAISLLQTAALCGSGIAGLSAWALTVYGILTKDLTLGLPWNIRVAAMVAFLVTFIPIRIQSRKEKDALKLARLDKVSKFLFNCASFMAITFAPAFLPTDNIIVATLIRFMAIVPITLALDATKEIITYWGKRAEADES
mgnify:FL=1